MQADERGGCAVESGEVVAGRSGLDARYLWLVQPHRGLAEVY